MKKLLVTVAVLASFASMAFAATGGTLRLSSYESGKPITLDGLPVTLSVGVQVEVLAGPLNGNLVPVTPFGASSPVFTLTSDGDFDAGYGVIPGIAGGTDQVRVQVRAWVGGTSYETAILNGSTPVWAQPSGTLPDLPNAPVPADLQFPGMALMQQIIPEPSTIALGLLGAALLLIRRRS